jgi:acetyltransferase-like isoleucine patch superfamily enzyme
VFFVKKVTAWAFRKLKRFFRIIDFKRRGIKVARGSYLSNGVTVGRCTRINNRSYIADCDIGAFCAIGGRLVVRSSNHSINTINIQGWAQRRIIKSNLKVDGYTRGRVTIGNGVWIGDSAIILPGAKIGDGAVIGAGSVVTKPIPPYAVAVGSPAKVVKYRFPPEIVNLIKDIYWWDWSDQRIREVKSFFEIDLQNISEDDLKTLLRDLKIISGKYD